MGFRDWFSRRSPLQLALERGMQPGNDLARELRGLGDYRIKSRADAEAICCTLSRAASEGGSSGGKSVLHPLIGLFQQIDGRECAAFSVLAEHGIPQLVRIVDGALQTPGPKAENDVLFALKILAMYGTRVGTDAVIRAARLPIQPDSYLWSLILRAYSGKHPEHVRLFEELSNPLPQGFLAVSLLDSANAAKREGAEILHPFDSAAGKSQLERWLTDDDEDHFSYAVSATVALPFISAPEQDSLLALAFEHSSSEVQLEAAWAAARLGREAGIKWLVGSCLDVNLSEKAQHYLSELDRSEAIPAEAKNADFQAKATFAQWLAHPNELGRPADELEIVDSRELSWPPEYESKPLWIIRYRVKDVTGLGKDDVGVGLVGSVTFCLFSYKLEQRPPEDCYAIHCYWEMKHADLLAESDVEDNSTEYDSMLRQCNMEGLSDLRIKHVVELSSELKYPQKLVALATATRNGQSGWMVLDGARSRWYPATDMAVDDVRDEGVVVMIHVGRELLGFTDEPDRVKYLRSATPRRTPEQIVVAWERTLETARTDPRQIQKLLGNSSVLKSAFADYTAALATTSAQSPAACTCKAYESLLAAAELADSASKKKLFGSFSPLGSAFEQYVAALNDLKRQADVPAVIETFRPHWDHNLGYGVLGSAAFKSGHDKTAEAFFVRLRETNKDWCRGEEIDHLAEIWKKQGRAEEAHTLLIDALKQLHTQSRTPSGRDEKRLYEQWFQSRRSAYLRLFAERGMDELSRQGIPSSTLGK